MAAITSHVTSEEYFGMRPMDPMQDLGGVADLIEEAFADELDQSGQNALQELRWLSRVKPVLWWMVYANPDHSDFLSGFVWEEDQKIVGNITVNKTGVGSRRWLISNVAVAKGYRRRGIARGLMYAAIELVHDYKGAYVSLQVRADNDPARRLYQELNFKEISGTTQLGAKSVPPVTDLPPIPGVVSLRPRNFDLADARAVYKLATEATPLTVQREWPLRQSQYELGSSEYLDNLLNWLQGGGSAAHWVVEDGRRLVASLNVYPGTWGKRHQLELMVHPDWRGILEAPLAARALEYLAKWPKRGIFIKHPSYHPQAIEAFQALGLKVHQTLIWMKRDM
jgi:ribosomal protein S18 acetylase RimI-like enzyme